MNMKSTLLILSLSVSAFALADNSSGSEGTIDQNDMLVDEFNFIDQNRSDTVDFNEFYAFMMDSDIRMLQLEFKQADRNKDRLLSFDEANQFDATLEEFDLADEDRSGHVDLEEFASFTLHSMFNSADVNRDQYVDLPEFKLVQTDE